MKKIETLKTRIMKEMKNIAVQQLSKEQMNTICGGTVYSCYVEGEWVGDYRGPSKEATEQYIQKLYGSGSCS